MQDLIERLELATAANRELDAEIWMTLHPEWRQYPRDDREGQPGWRTPRDGRAWCADYTASIDDALMLVPDGKWWLIGAGKMQPTEPLYGAQIREPMYLEEEIIGEGESAATAAIALCIAALRARGRYSAALEVRVAHETVLRNTGD